jgi:hypothetical protein
MRAILTIVGLSGLLCACNADRIPGRAEAFASPAEIAAKDDRICRGYGAEPGSLVYIQCRATQDVRRDAFKRG